MSRQYKGNILCRSIQIYPVGDEEEVKRVYKYLRDAMYNQSLAYNILIGNVYSAIYQNKSKEEIDYIYKIGKRIPKENFPEYSLYKYGEIQFPKGLGTPSNVGQKVKSKIEYQQKQGLFKGKVRLAGLKLNSPLWVRSQFFSFYHEYENYNEFEEHLFKNDLKIFMKFVNNITFKVIFGSPHKSYALREEFKNIFEGYYVVKESQIGIDETKIMLYLTMEIPKKSAELDENVVVGVDLGIAVPAVCALNTNAYARKYIGTKDDFIRVRQQLQDQRTRLYKSLKSTSGGHGRKKKLQALNRLKSRESNFTRTYNHYVSKNVVDFALQHNAKYINLECLKGYNTSKFILRNWSYYQLQQQIKSKAERYGIIVRFINPCYTSQVCSYCGNWEEGQRKTQSKFECANPNCKSHKIKEGVNADFNAARNIAMSTLFLDNKEVKKIGDKHKKEARLYYGINISGE